MVSDQVNQLPSSFRTFGLPDFGLFRTSRLFPILLQEFDSGMLTLTEENYIKAIYRAEGNSGQPVSTKSISEIQQVNAASVTDMFKKLCDQKLVIYEKSRGVKLTDKGRKNALKIVRKHRLWETFLVEKLKFAWDEVHDVAEQLEHRCCRAIRTYQFRSSH
jgi:Mn-dependent DtxR family transcriptional regulator